MMIFEQLVSFFMEWGWLMALFLSVGLIMATDLFPRIYSFIAHIESEYPQFKELLYTKEKDLIDRYEFLPARIRSGFALIGGKQAWAWLVTRMYRFLREQTKPPQKEKELDV
ncbi:hypothetical protein [Brevibacillus brevis]|uniref:hypothetical protein n=1 Tax=Brevibacillus brevis TaxID=1393 RepID=UPI002570BF89|nr:hypothetical protein [Lysinibacillus sp. SDF0063]